MKIGIVGGGASALFLANYLSRLNLNIDITIFERNKSLARKVLASGNGKCNFSNFKAIKEDYNNPLFMDNLFKHCPKDELINYFSSLGLMFYFDNEGRMYPLSNSSQTIVDLLESDLKNTCINLNYTVNKVEVKDGNPYIDSNKFDIVVLASGSNASIDLSKIDSTYNYLKPLNLKMVPVRPSLVGFKCKLKDINILKGFRSKSIVSMYRDSKLIFKEFGEVIFKEDGISGIVVMNASHYYKPYDKIILNLLPNIELNEFIYKANLRKKINPSIDYFLSGLIHPTLINYLKKENITDIEKIVEILTNFDVKVISTYSMKEAQVSKGGIDLEEIDYNFKIKKYNSIYALGELLDINGLCGGYNLMFAFSSALVLGKEIKRIYEDKNN